MKRDAGLFIHSLIWLTAHQIYALRAGCQSFRAEVLNVMTGVFVNSAIKTRERDHETLIQNKQKFTDLVQKLLGHSPKYSDA